MNEAICSAGGFGLVFENVFFDGCAHARNQRGRVEPPRVVRTFNQALRAGANYFINSGLAVTQNRVFFGGSAPCYHDL